ncbi:MAG: Hsp20/alpha crystallin family protein [Vicinamibacteria bacterium]
MAKAEVSITNTDFIVDEIMRRQELIARRAFELFRGHEALFIADFDDWLQAENELFPQPSIDVRKLDNHFEIDAALPGVDPKKLDVKVTAEDVLITGEREAPKAEPMTAVAAGTTSDGRMQYFRSIHLPEPIDPSRVKAHYKHGHLHVSAPIMKLEPKAIEVHA